MPVEVTCDNAERSWQTARATYRYLRAGMVVVIVMLFAAILIDSIPASFQGSISAYYYTPARNVFVAALCCLGIMLIVYKGSRDAEDVLLNLAGTLAFFVAFVPVKLYPGHFCQQFLGAGDDRCGAIGNNVGAVIVALIVAVAIIVFVFVVDPKSRGETTLWGNGLRVVSVGVLGCFVAAFLFRPELFDAKAHYFAAGLIFLIIGAVVFLNAFLVTKQHPDTQERYRGWYLGIGCAMVGSLIAAIVTAVFGERLHVHGNVLFPLETALLLEFALFWGLQTHELWHYTDRNCLIPETKQREIARI